MTPRGAARVGFHSGDAFGEGWRTALAGRWASVAVIAAIAWGVGLLGAADARSVQDLRDQELAWLERGGTVFLIRAEGSGGISRTGCVALAEVTGVYASAAFARRGEPIRLSQAPRRDLAAFTTVGDVWGLVGVADSPSRGVVLPAQVAERLGLRDGSLVVIGSTFGGDASDLPRRPVPVTVAGMDQLGEELRGVLLPEAPSRPSAVEAVCVVRTTAPHRDALREIVPALVAPTNTTVVADRIPPGPFGSATRAYEERILAPAWVPAGMLIGGLWLIVQWMRRSQDALYASLGAAQGALAIIRLTEWAALAVIGAAWAVSLGFVAACVTGVEPNIALPHVVRTAGATVLIASAVVVLRQLKAPRSVLADLKDR